MSEALPETAVVRGICAIVLCHVDEMHQNVVIVLVGGSNHGQRMYRETATASVMFMVSCQIPYQKKKTKKRQDVVFLLFRLS